MKRLTAWLFVGAALVLLSLVAFWLLMPAALHYHLFGDESSLNAALSKQVKSGDSEASIVQLLGPGVPITEAKRARLLKAIGDFQRQTPHSVPAGVDSDDTFSGYEASGMTIYLQFRDRKLINFRPKDFEHPANVHVSGS